MASDTEILTAGGKTRAALTSSHWGSYRPRVEQGQLVGMDDFDQDRDPSPIGKAIVGLLDAPSRIAYPAVRRSWLEEGPGAAPHRRGREPFVEVDWQTATRLVADEYRRVIDNFGNSAIYAGSYGWASAGRFHHAQSQIHRFLNCLGGYTRSVNTYSFAAAEVIVPHVLGDFRGIVYTMTSWQSLRDNCELLVAFGGVPLKNGQINQGGTGDHVQRHGLRNAANAGVRMVNISPLRSDIMEECGADWLALRPNTDTALMLGLCHSLLAEGLHDQTFLDRYTSGFEPFRAYLEGETDGIVKSASWAAEICAVPETTITSLARRMAASRTMISISWSLTRQQHGEMPYWAAIALASMLGQIGLPGGGFGFGYSAVNTVGNAMHQLDYAALPQGRNGVESFIPVARISDMLLNPGADFVYNGQRYSFPDIRMMVWAGGNPFHHHQDITRMLRAWQKPETIIVHEWCWNASAKHADIVLPCTVTVERQDIAMTPRDPYIVMMDQVVAPHAGARDDYAILGSIAEHLGVAERFTEGRTAEEWQRWLYEVSRQQVSRDGVEMPSYDMFHEKGWWKAPPLEEDPVLLADFRRDPQRNPLQTPSGKIELFSTTIAGFKHGDFPPHPTWLEPKEWLGAADRGTRLHLVSNQPSNKLHSQLDHGMVSRADKIKDRETVMINAADADHLGISNGELVRVFNDRGACLAAAVLSADIMPGVVLISTGAWADPAYPEDMDQPLETALLCRHGNPNMLAPDIGTSALAQGPSAHSCLVSIERLQEEAPKVEAFEPPQRLRQS